MAAGRWLAYLPRQLELYIYGSNLWPGPTNGSTNSENCGTRGLQQARIAEELGGVSRNAVIGKSASAGPKIASVTCEIGESQKESRGEESRAQSASKAESGRRCAAQNGRRQRHQSLLQLPQRLKSGQQICRAWYQLAPAALCAKAQVTSKRLSRQHRRAALFQPSQMRRWQNKTSLLDLNERVCRWPINHPGEADFHFCGVPVNPGFPYCVEHCGRAYQAQLPRGVRRPPPPMPFGGPAGQIGWPNQPFPT